MLTALGVNVHSTDSWYIDSAASKHMTGRVDWMTKFDDSKEVGSEVTVANNCKLYSGGMGDVPVHTCFYQGM